MESNSSFSFLLNEVVEILKIDEQKILNCYLFGSRCYGINKEDSGNL